MSRFFAALAMALSGCATAPYPPSDHFDGKRFFMPWAVAEPGFADVVKWRWTSDDPDWPDEMRPTQRLVPPPRVEGRALKVSWVGHSTFLLQSQGMNLLTDPIWSDWAGPLRGLGSKRVHAPAIDFDRLPRIDVVLVSHNHYDHLDLPTLRRLQERDGPRIVAPLGLGRWLRDEGFDKVDELDWWQGMPLSPEARVTATPAQHWSKRSLFDGNETLWAGYWLELGGWRLFFSGDTGLGPHIGQIRERLGAPHVAFLPIGAYLPQWFMSSRHMGPEDALKARDLLEAEVTIPHHHDTFPLGSDDYGEALAELESLFRKRGGAEVQALNRGEIWSREAP